MRKTLTICAALFITTFASFAYAAPTVCSVGNGCTGWPNVVTGTVLYGNGAGRFGTTTAATNGMILAWANGIPTPVATSTYTYPLSFNAATNAVSSAATSTAYTGTPGQILAFLNGAWAGAATTTFTGTAPISLTYANGQVTGACLGATGSQNGCITSTDWNTFNLKNQNIGATTTAPMIASWYSATSTVVASFFPQATTTQLTTSDIWVLLGSNHVAILNDNASASAIAGINGSLIGQSSLFQVAAAGTAALAFNTGGTRNSMTAGSERARITAGGLFLIGTTTPNFSQLIIASSTGPQIGYSDTNALDYAWTERAINNNYYLATSTAAATSSVPAMSIMGSTSAFTFNSGATSTFTSALQTTYLNVVGTTASSTFGNGMSINVGCYSIAFACISFQNIAGALNLANQVTGTLGAGNGGTGATSLSGVSLAVVGGVLKVNTEHLFDYPATSSTNLFQAGTSTLHSVFSETGTILSFSCAPFPPSNAFMNVQIGTGAASTSMANASSTVGINGASLAVTAGQKMYVDFGTTTVPTGISDMGCSYVEQN